MTSPKAIWRASLGRADKLSELGQEVSVGIVKGFAFDLHVPLVLQGYGMQYPYPYVHLRSLCFLFSRC